MPELDDAHRPAWLFGRTVRESCNRGGYVEQGQFATEYGDDPRCLVKLGCKGPVVKCNVPELCRYQPRTRANAFGGRIQIIVELNLCGERALRVF